MLIGNETNDVIPSLPFTKDISGSQYRKFVDYRTGKSSKELPLPSTAYWKPLEKVLTDYVIHNDHKFDYSTNSAKRLHIITDRIRYIGKESNNLDESQVIGIDDDSYLEYVNLEEFKQWVLSLKPKDVRDKGISERGFKYLKKRIRENQKIGNT